MKKYINEIKFYIIAQLVLDTLSIVSVAVIPYFQKILFDLLSNKHNEFSFISLTVIYFTCVIGNNVFIYFSSIYTWKGNICFEVSLKRDFFNNIFCYDYEKFSTTNIGEYISLQGNDITAIEQDYLQPCVDLIRSLIALLIYSTILFIYVDWRIASVIFISSLFTISIPKMTGKGLSKRRNEYLEQMGKYVTSIKDFLEGFKVIQSRTRNSINNEHEKALTLTAEKRYIFGKYKTFTITAYSLALNGINLFVFFLAGMLLLKGEISVGTGVATFSYLGCFVGPLQDILHDVNSINSLKEVKEKVFAYIESKPSRDLLVMEKFSDSIVLDNVSYHYQGFSLDNFSYKFEKGKKYALIGHSGSGKSTIVNLLMKYIKKESGEILIDENDLMLYDTSYIMCCVNQNEHIFADNYINNITVFSSYASANIDAFFPLNKRYFESISNNDNSQFLSGGEKQVISAIRMLASNTPICIMDEPFSAMDTMITQSIQNALLSMKDKMIIMVTHKLSEQLKQFDEVIIMEHGKIIKSGPYDEVEKTSEYKNLLLEKIY